MARYPKEHKAETRARILETARQEFRANGFEQASIDSLMGAAGLTRGGFYAHFASKEDLVREVLRIDAGFVKALEGAVGVEDSAGAAVRAVGTYLDPEEPESLLQCPLVAHAMDARRGGSDRTELYAAQVERVLEAFEGLGPGDQHSRDGAAIATILTVGTAMLTAAVGESEIRDRLRDAGLSAVLDLLGPNAQL